MVNKFSINRRHQKGTLVCNQEHEPESLKQIRAILNRDLNPRQIAQIGIKAIDLIAAVSTREAASVLSETRYIRKLWIDSHLLSGVETENKETAQ